MYRMSSAALASRRRGAETNRRKKRIIKRTSASVDKELADKAKSYFGSVMNALEYAVVVYESNRKVEPMKTKGGEA